MPSFLQLTKRMRSSEKIKLYTNKAMTINGLTLLMQLPKSLSDFAKYDDIKENEFQQYARLDQWFKKGQLDGSMINGDPEEHRNFLFGSLFYLHQWYAIRDNESYAHIQPFIEQMIDRMYSTNFRGCNESSTYITLILWALESLIYSNHLMGSYFYCFRSFLFIANCSFDRMLSLEIKF